MDTTSQPQPPPLPSDSYQPVLAEETSDTPTGEPKQHESAIYAEIASLINHSDIQTILATQAEMYPLFCIFLFTLYFLLHLIFVDV